MKEILEYIVQVFLMIALILNMVAMIYVIYINHKRFQDDKKCWAQRDKVVEEIRELADEIEEETKKYIESHSNDCDKLADDPKECIEDEKTNDRTENTDKD